MPEVPDHHGPRPTRDQLGTALRRFDRHDSAAVPRVLPRWKRHLVSGRDARDSARSGTREPVSNAVRRTLEAGRSSHENWRPRPWALSAAALMASCGSLEAAVAPTVASDVTLEGGTWVLTEGTVRDRPIVVPDGSRVTLTAGQDDQVGGSAACNGYGAIANIEGDLVSFTMTGSGLMRCADDAMTAEKDFVEALPRVTTGSRRDGTLHLSGPDVALTFELSKPVAVEDISGIEWHLESLVVGDQATPAEAERASLLLAEDGTVSGSTGCRQLHGRYDAFGDQINFPEFGAEGDCRAALKDQDNHIVGVLGDGFRAEVQGRELRLTSDGNVGLVYRRS